MSDELVRRLRKGDPFGGVMQRAADRIEALEAELAKADALADQCELFANGKLYSMNPVIEAREAYREARK